MKNFALSSYTMKKKNVRNDLGCIGYWLKRLQAESKKILEHDEETAKLFVETLGREKENTSYSIRAQEKRNKPPTKA
ncbi:hypothetical protein Tco_0889168 [Tanacetum coccineum]